MHFARQYLEYAHTLLGGVQLKALIILLTNLICFTVQADVVYMLNGDRITGEITQIWRDSLTIEPSYSGEFEIDIEDIASFETENTFDIEFNEDQAGDFTVARSQNDGEVILQSELEEIPVTLVDLRRLDELEEFFEWDARVDLNQSLSRGTNNSFLLNLNSELELRWGDHRTITNLSTIREELDDETIKEQDRFNLSYNYLFTDSWFLAANFLQGITPQVERGHFCSVLGP